MGTKQGSGLRASVCGKISGPEEVFNKGAVLERMIDGGESGSGCRVRCGWVKTADGGKLGRDQNHYHGAARQPGFHPLALALGISKRENTLTV